MSEIELYAQEDRIVKLEAEIERLTAERGDWMSKFCEKNADLTLAQMEIERLTAEIERLRRAPLAPKGWKRGDPLSGALEGK